jgi:CrcB protein
MEPAWAAGPNRSHRLLMAPDIHPLGGVRSFFDALPTGRKGGHVDKETIAPYLAISLGGVLGANARYLVAVYVAERLGAEFPYGTMLINVTGSLVIGFFLTLVSERLEVSPLWRLFFATGFLGAYTTFSTYAFETATLLREGAYGPALTYLFGSVAAGMIGVMVGIALAERL